MGRAQLPENPTILDYVERQITEAVQAAAGLEYMTAYNLRADLLRLHAEQLITLLDFRKGLV